TPAGLLTPRQRAISPSLQSNSNCAWISNNATIADHNVGIVNTAAASGPLAIISQVTPFGVIRVGSSALVRYSDTCRMYSLPAQCSPLTLPITSSGCHTSRSWAIEGYEEVIDTVSDLRLIQRQVFKNSVRIRPGQIGRAH